MDSIESFHVIAIDALMKNEDRKDGQELVSICVVRGIHQLSLINQELLFLGADGISDETRGELFDLLAGLTNLLMVLYYVTETEVPEEDELIEYTEMYPTDFAVDGILASFFAISALTEITFTIFDTDLPDDPNSEEAKDTKELVGSHLSDVYSTIMILCELYEIDFGEVIEYASQKTEWE